MSAPSGFNPNASMLPDPGPSAAPIQVMKGGGGTNAAAALSKGPADTGAEGAAGIPSTGDNFTPEELAELTKYQLHPEGVIYNDIDLPTKRAFLEQLKDTTRCRRTTGDSIVLGKECWAIAKVIRALLRAKITKGNANHLEPAPGNAGGAGGTPAPGGLTRGIGSRRLVPGSGNADNADDAGDTPAFPGDVGDIGGKPATSTGGTPAPLPAPGGTPVLPGTGGTPALPGTGGTPAPLPAPGGTPASGNAGRTAGTSAPLPTPGGTGGTPVLPSTGGTAAAALPLGTDGPLVGPPVNLTTPPQQPEPSLEDLLAEAEAYYGDRPSPCGPFAPAEEAGAGGIAATEAAGAAGNENNASVNEETRETPRTAEELDQWIQNYAAEHGITIGEESWEPAEPKDPFYRPQISDNPEFTALMKKNGWDTVRTQGGGHCFLHAALTSLSPTYRKLSWEDRGKVGAAYRKEEFYKLFTPEEFKTFGPKLTNINIKRLEYIPTKLWKDMSSEERNHYEQSRHFIKESDQFLTESNVAIFCNVFKINIFVNRRLGSPPKYQYDYAIIRPSTQDQNALNPKAEVFPWIFMFNTLNNHYSSIKISKDKDGKTKTGQDIFLMNDKEYHDTYDTVLGKEEADLFNEYLDFRQEIVKALIAIKPKDKINKDPTEKMEKAVYTLDPYDVAELPDGIRAVVKEYGLPEKRADELIEKFQDGIDLFITRVYPPSSNENKSNSGSESGSNSNSIGSFANSNENEQEGGSCRKRRSAYTFIKRTRRRRNAKQSRKQRK